MQDVALAETDAKLTTRYVRVVFRLVVEMSFVVKLQKSIETSDTTLNFFCRTKNAHAILVQADFYCSLF